MLVFHVIRYVFATSCSEGTVWARIWLQTCMFHHMSLKISLQWENFIAQWTSTIVRMPTRSTQAVAEIRDVRFCKTKHGTLSRSPSLTETQPAINLSTSMQVRLYGGGRHVQPRTDTLRPLARELAGHLTDGRTKGRKRKH